VSVALVIQHAKRMRHVTFSSLACVAPPYFSTLSHKRHDFQKTLLNLKCLVWFSLQLYSERFLILRRNRRDIINVDWCSCRIPLYSCQILMKLEFSRQIFERSSNIIKIRPVGAELFHADRHMTKLIFAFRNFANAPVNYVNHLWKHMVVFGVIPHCYLIFLLSCSHL
jgi:hypothetical protein